MFYIFFIQFGAGLGVTVFKDSVFCAIRIMLSGIRDSWGSLASSRFNLLGIAIKQVHEYILLALCNTLHTNSSKYARYNIDYKRDVSLCMRVSKEILKRKR